ncbi:MAG: N-6 DNA methylase [Candidatus Helarchaeota archaeon]
MAYFTSEYDLQLVVQRCHNIIWERHGVDPAQAFDEFTKIFFIKYYCEVEGRNNELNRELGEPLKKYYERINNIFNEVLKSPKYSDIFNKNERLLTDENTIYYVIQEIGKYNFLSTSEISGIDLKGTIFETMIGNTFREKLGQFFTPRTLIDFMVKFIGPKEIYKIYDPACGSGGFLINYTFNLRNLISNKQNLSNYELKKEIFNLSKFQIYGTDINSRAIKMTKINLLMHDISYKNIYHENALKISENSEAIKNIKNDSFDIILTNPPFAGYEKDPSVLMEYDLGKNGKGFPTSITREVLFIERIINLLKNGGIAGIVLPQGIFTNNKLKKVRDYIKKNSKILAVIELPDWAFIPSGTSVRGSLLFLQKMQKPPKSYDIFMKRVENIGYNSTGRVTEKNDLPKTLIEFKSNDKEYLVNINNIKDRIDAKFYINANVNIINMFTHEKKYPLIKLSDLGSFNPEKVSVKNMRDKYIRLVEISDVDPEKLKIYPKEILKEDCKYTTLLRLKENDILISRRRPYRGAIVKVSENNEGIFAITEFSVLRVYPKYDVNYIVEMIRSKPFLKLMTIYTTGEMSGRISKSNLKNLKIPLPPNYIEISQQIQKIRKEIHNLHQEIITKKKEINNILEKVI